MLFHSIHDKEIKITQTLSSPLETTKKEIMINSELLDQYDAQRLVSNT